MKSRSYSAHLVLFALVLVVFVGLFAALRANASETVALLTGTVKDSSGAIVPSAAVTLTNTGTGIARTTQTSSDGSYTFNLVPIGSYQVTVEKKGFRNYVQSGITLEVNQNARVDVTLQVGTASEVVEVTANASQVDTVGATLGAVENTQRILDLPLVGRDTLQLGELQAGVFPADENDGSGNLFSVSGQRSESVTFLLNGADNNDFLGNNIVADPNPDAVGEFKILTNNYDAEFGRSSGGIVNQEIKAGTNAYHGDIFEFFRNTVFNSRNYFNHMSVPPYHRNIYGGTIGGPIYKNKAFFFLSYQGLRRSQGQDGPQLVVLSPAERGCGANVAPGCVGAVGDFSETGGGLVDPTTGNLYPTSPSGVPGSMVPINPIIANYIKDFLPLPNGMNNSFVAFPGLTEHQEQGVARVDYHISDRNTISGSYIINDLSDLLPFNINNGASTGGNVPVGSGFSDKIRSQIGTISWTHTFSPSLINEALFSANRDAILQASPTTTTSPSALGFTNVFPDDPGGVAPPIIQVETGFFNLGPSPQGPTTLHDATFNWQDNLSWTKGNHNMKFGADIRRVRNNFLFDFYNNGAFFFGSGGVNYTGSALADFDAGFFSQFEQFSSARYGIRTYDYHFYAQDSWKVTPRFTVDYGMRYEFNSPLTDVTNQILGFFPGQTSTKFPNAPTGVLFAGDAGTPNNALTFPDRNNFAPRVGFAWDILGTGKLVMRGGTGIFYDIEDGALNLQFGGEPPFGAVTFFNPNTSGSFSYAGLTGVNTIADPFTPFGQPNLFPTGGKFAGFPPPVGGVPSAVGFTYVADPHFRTPYAINANFGFQYQVQKDTLIEAYYVGSLSRKSIITNDDNPPLMGVLQQQFALNGFTNLPCARPLAVCFDPALPNQGPAAAALDPNAFPTNIFGALFTNHSGGTSDSHQLQMTVDKRFSHGFNVRGAYTLSKTIDTQSGFRYNTSVFTNPSDINFDRGLANFDVTHRLVVSYLWEIPWDKPFKNGNLFMKKLTEGWQLTGVAFYQSGVPFTVFSGLDSSNFQTGLDRANKIGTTQTFDPHKLQNFSSNCYDDIAVNPLPSPANFYFSPAAYDCANVPMFTFGNSGRNSVRGPGRQNYDISIQKRFKFGESRSVEFRTEFFNAFNHTQFFNPINTGGSSQFGQVVQAHDPRIIQFALKVYF